MISYNGQHRQCGRAIATIGARARNFVGAIIINTRNQAKVKNRFTWDKAKHEFGKTQCNLCANLILAISKSPKDIVIFTFF